MTEKSLNSCGEMVGNRVFTGGAEPPAFDPCMAILDDIPQAVFEVDLRGIIKFANRYAVSKYAMSIDDVRRGFNMLNLLVPEDRDRALANVRRRMSGDRTGANIYRAILKDGSPVPVLVISSPVCQDDKPVGLRGVVVDLSDSRLDPEDLVKALEHQNARRTPGTEQGDDSESAALEQEQYYRTLFQNAHDPILIFTPEDEIILDVNQRACEVYGYSRGEMIGMSLKAISRDVRAGEEGVRLTLDNGLIRNFETVQIRKDGAEVTLEVNASAIRFRGRTVILSVNRDVTERKRLEVEKAKLLEQLSYSRKMDAISLMAGGIAHDFNNILTAVMGFAELGRMSVEACEPVGDSFDKILDASARAAKLTGQLLRVSRRKHFRTSQVDVNALVRKVVAKLCTPAVTAASVRVVLAERLGRIRGDEEGLFQVIESLTAAALDAAGEHGSVRIETSDSGCAPELADPSRETPVRGMVCIGFSDSGPGMDEESLSRVFDPFYKADGFGAGRGLGLAVAYGIVRQHGGTLEAQSRPGEGSSFKVMLPADEEAAHGSRITGGVPASSGGGRAILLVEDDQSVLEMTREALCGAGFAVTACASAEEAADAFARMHAQPDLLLTDVVLPGRTGPEFAEEILKVAPNVRVIFMSGYLSGSEEWFARRGGTFGFLQKPFPMAEMISTVRSALASGAIESRTH